MLKEQNGQITASQMSSLLALELFGLVTLFLPDLLSRQLAQDSLAGLALGVFFGVIYILYAVWFQKHTKGRLWMRDGKRNIFEEGLIIVWFMQCVLLAIFTLNMAVELAQDFLLAESERFTILFTFYLVSIYGAYKGVECRGRMAEWIAIIFWVILALFLLLSIRNVDFNQYESLFLHAPQKIMRGGYDTFILFESVSFGIFAAVSLNRKECFGKAMKRGFAIASVFSFLTLLSLMGTFGGRYLAKMEWPVIRLLRSVVKKGHFFSRMDILLIAIWLVSLFFLVSGALLYGSNLLETALDSRREIYLKPVLFLIIFLLAWLFENAMNSYYVYRNYMFYIGTPLIIILMFCAVFWKRRRGHESH